MLLGCLGASLGSSMVRNACKKHIETHVVVNASFRHPSSFRTLLEAILVYFWPIWDPEMGAESHQKLVLQTTPCLDRKKTRTDPQNEPDWGPKQDVKRNTKKNMRGALEIKAGPGSTRKDRSLYASI